MNRSTLLLLKTRLKYSAQQLCVIMNGVLIGFKLRPSHGTTFFDDRLEKKSAVGEVATAISSEMEAEDSALGGIDGTVDSPRLRLALLDKHANRTLNFLSGEVKLNYLQLKLVAQSVPYLLATPADSVLRPRLRFLEGRLNFSTAQLTRVIAAAPTILNCSTAAVLEPKLGFLEMRLRLTRPQVRKIGGWTDRWLLFLFLFCLIVSSDCVRLLPLSLVCSSRARATPQSADPPNRGSDDDDDDQGHGGGGAAAADDRADRTHCGGAERNPATPAVGARYHRAAAAKAGRFNAEASWAVAGGRVAGVRRFYDGWRVSGCCLLVFVFLNRAPLFAYSCSFLPTPAFCRRSGSHRTTFRRSSWACRACCWPTLRTS